MLTIIEQATTTLVELRATLSTMQALLTRCTALGEDVTRIAASLVGIRAIADEMAWQLGCARRASLRAELDYVEVLLRVQRTAGLTPLGAAAGWLLAECGGETTEEVRS